MTPRTGTVSGLLADVDARLRCGWRQVDLEAEIATVRDAATFKVSQRQAAERSLERGRVPWAAAVVSEVLTGPKATLLASVEGSCHLAARINEEVH